MIFSESKLCTIHWKNEKDFWLALQPRVKKGKRKISRDYAHAREKEKKLGWISRNEARKKKFLDCGIEGSYQEHENREVSTECHLFNLRNDIEIRCRVHCNRY